MLGGWELIFCGFFLLITVVPMVVAYQIVVRSRDRRPPQDPDADGAHAPTQASGRGDAS